MVRQQLTALLSGFLDAQRVIAQLMVLVPRQKSLSV